MRTDQLIKEIAILAHKQLSSVLTQLPIYMLVFSYTFRST